MGAGGNSRSSEAGEGRSMAPESPFSFEQMLTSFAYGTVGTTTFVVGGGDNGVAGGCGKKQTKAKWEATAKGDKRSPAPPQTPPRPSRGRAGPSSLPQPDRAAAAGGTTAAETAGMTPLEAVVADSTLARTFATVEDESRGLVVPPARPGTPLVLPPDKNRGSSSPYLRKRKDVVGNPATVSRFFLCHHTSTATGGEEKAGEGRNERAQIGRMEEVGEEGKRNPFPDGERKGKRIEATNKGKKRRKRSCGDASLPLHQSKVGGDGQSKSKKKKKKKKVVVVSPYFVAAFSDQRVPETGAGVEDEVEVVVQRRTKKKRTSQAAGSAAEPRTSSGRHQGRPTASDGKKKERKREDQSVQLSAEERMADAYKRVPDDNPWVPPFSDHELLQEFHFFDHWRALVICMLLNRTTGREVQKVLPRLFLLCPDAGTTTKVSEEHIEEIIKHLGLQKKRSKMIKRMSEEYLRPEWTHVTQLYGIGKYAADAYAIFCSGMWKEVKPKDHKLVDYWRFLLDDKDARESIMVQKST